MAISFNGEFTVSATRQDAYDFLSDPRKFAPCLPTYESLEMKNERTGDVTVKVGVGKIRGSAVVELTLKDEQSPTHAGYDGKGKIMGSAFNLATTFDLEDAEGGGTVVKWAGDLNMFGKLVALAGGLIRPIAKKDIKRLVDALQAEMSKEHVGTSAV
jgi:carbon monoxide dehydrogenase subunit G